MAGLIQTLDEYRDDIYLSLYKILSATSGSLLNPCYNPPIANMMRVNIKNSLWRVISTETEFDFSEYISTHIIKKIQPYLLFRDETVWFLLLVSLHSFLKKKPDRIDLDLCFLGGYLLLMKYYTSLSNKHMSKFCDKTKALLALDTLSEKALFSAKNVVVTRSAKSSLGQYSLSSKIKNDLSNSSIALGMLHIFNMVKDNYFVRIEDLNDPKRMSNLIIILRSRISQSFKAYAQHYYKLATMRIGSTDENDDSVIANAIFQVVSNNSQRLVHIPDLHFQQVMQYTGVTTDIVKKMYEVSYRISDNQNTVSTVVGIFLRDGRYERLIESQSLYEWLNVAKEVVAIRTKYDVRNMLFQLIESSSELSAIFEEKSDSYKYKMLQSMGLIIAVSIYDTLKSYTIARVMNTCLII